MNGAVSRSRKSLFTEHVDHNFVPIPATPPANKRAQPPIDINEFKAILERQDTKKIKQCLREEFWPVDHEIRKSLWIEICKLKHKDHGSIYHEMMESMFGHGQHGDITLPGFVDPATMLHYHLNHEGVLLVKKLMCVLGHTNPDITFSPAVFALTSLFLHYMDDEQCFTCVYEFLRSSHDSYLTHTKLSYQASGYVLKDLAKKYARSAHSYISKNVKQPETIYENWKWWILRDLPFAYTVRIMDIFLHEGVKVLYRIALAILILYNKHVVRQSPKSKETSNNIAQSISQFCEEIPVTREKLLKTAFNIRGFTRKEIRKLQLKNEMYITSFRHLDQAPHLTKSASCESLDLKIQRSGSHDHGLTIPQSSLLSRDEWQALWRWLPARMTVYQPELLYTMNEHGTSLRTLFSRVEGHEPTIMLIKASTGEIFGAYCSTDWQKRPIDKMSFFGTGETFIFSMQPKRVKYEWIGVGKTLTEVPSNGHMFQAASDSVIIIGGGGNDAIRLDEELRQGRTDHCITYKNQPFVESKDFNCANVEVFTLV